MGAAKAKTGREFEPHSSRTTILALATAGFVGVGAAAYALYPSNSGNAYFRVGAMSNSGSHGASSAAQAQFRPRQSQPEPKSTGSAYPILRPGGALAEAKNENGTTLLGLPATLVVDLDVDGNGKAVLSPRAYGNAGPYEFYATGALARLSGRDAAKGGVPMGVPMDNDGEGRFALPLKGVKPGFDYARVAAKGTRDAATWSGDILVAFAGPDLGAFAASASPPTLQAIADGATPSCMGDDDLVSGGRRPVSYVLSGDDETEAATAHWRDREGGGFCVVTFAPGEKTLQVEAVDAHGQRVRLKVAVSAVAPQAVSLPNGASLDRDAGAATWDPTGSGLTLSAMASPLTFQAAQDGTATVVVKALASGGDPGTSTPYNYALRGTLVDQLKGQAAAQQAYSEDGTFTLRDIPVGAYTFTVTAFDATRSVTGNVATVVVRSQIDEGPPRGVLGAAVQVPVGGIGCLKKAALFDGGQAPLLYKVSLADGTASAVSDPDPPSSPGFAPDGVCVAGHRVGHALATVRATDARWRSNYVKVDVEVVGPPPHDQQAKEEPRR